MTYALLSFIFDILSTVEDFWNM